MRTSTRLLLILLVIVIIYMILGLIQLNGKEINPIQAPPIIKTQIVPVEKIVYQPDPDPIDAEPLGEFEITYYTAGPESTGKRPGDPGYGETASGAIVTKGVTVAVDPDIIELGSYIYIEGLGFRVAQDTGSAINGKDIDVYEPNLKKAQQLGRHKAKVYLISKGATPNEHPTNGN